MAGGLDTVSGKGRRLFIRCRIPHQDSLCLPKFIEGCGSVIDALTKMPCAYRSSLDAPCQSQIMVIGRLSRRLSHRAVTGQEKELANAGYAAVYFTYAFE